MEDIDKIIASLTLTEKAKLLQGSSEWETLQILEKGVPSIFMSDGPHGLRKQNDAGDHLGLQGSAPSTCFPTAATLANSWDEDTVYSVGKALGKEAQALGIDIVLGPGVNIKRSPLCGRNFEYYSEDPYLAGKMAAALIKGIQSEGTGACIKHFACNSQELRRQSMDAVVDERTLREIYLTAFEIAIKQSKPEAVMTSYNKINGVHANENAHLIRDILRNEWKFDGMVMSDWGGDNDRVKSVKNGSDLLMPYCGAFTVKQLTDAVKSGELSEEDIDARCKELLSVVFRHEKRSSGRIDADAHHETAKKAAGESIVLLENDGILPLKKETEIAVIGRFARYPRYQGAGSSLVNTTKLDNLENAIKELGCKITAFESGYSTDEPERNAELLKKASELAKSTDTVILCAGLDDVSECEGMDRETLKLPEYINSLINEVCRANDNVILVLSGGAPFIIPDNRYRAVIHGYLGGQAGAAAMAEAIYGVINPSGKLNETWPLKLEDTPCFNYYPSKEKTSEYRESIYAGYRYYDTADVPLKYPFGYGLSYSSFEYSDLHIDGRTISFYITNTSDTDGRETAQIYVSKPDSAVFRPKKELKGFKKVFIKAHEKVHVKYTLDDFAFRIYDKTIGAFVTENGSYTIMVGRNVSDICLTGNIYVDGISLETDENLKSYYDCDIKNVSDKEYEALLGHKIPDSRWSRETICMNDSVYQLYYAKSPAARLVHKIILSKKEKSEKNLRPDLTMLFAYNVSIIGIAKIAQGICSEKMMEYFLRLCNKEGHFNFVKMFSEYQKNKKLNEEIYGNKFAKK